MTGVDIVELPGIFVVFSQEKRDKPFAFGIIDNNFIQPVNNISQVFLHSRPGVQTGLKIGHQQRCRYSLARYIRYAP